MEKIKYMQAVIGGIQKMVKKICIQVEIEPKIFYSTMREVQSERYEYQHIGPIFLFHNLLTAYKIISLININSLLLEAVK